MDSDAKEIGAVNTVLNYNKKLSGHNTDRKGAMMALGTNIKNKTVMVLGAGGASKAIIFGLKKNKANIIIKNSKCRF